MNINEGSTLANGHGTKRRESKPLANGLGTKIADFGRKIFAPTYRGGATTPIPQMTSLPGSRCARLK